MQAAAVESLEQREAFERIDPALAFMANALAGAVLWIVKAALIAACLVVGIGLNYEVANGESIGWLAFSVITLPLASAAVIVATSNRLSAHERLFGAALAIAFIGMNSLTHLSNSASSHDRDRDRAGYEFQEKTRVDTRLKELDSARAEQVSIAGNAAVSAIESEIRQKQATYATAWNMSRHCNQEYMSNRGEQILCSALGELNKKLAAATERDKIDAERKTLTAKDVRPVRSRVDSQITAIANTLAVFGATVDAKRREWIASALDWVRVGILELISSFGPKLVLLLFAALDPRRAAERRTLDKARQTVKLEARKAAAKSATEAAEPKEALPDHREPDSDPQLAAFLLRTTVRAPGAKLKGADLFAAWKADCAQQGIEPGTAQAFTGRAKLHVHCERKNKRTTYCGIALKERGQPHLRVVGGRT